MVGSGHKKDELLKGYLDRRLCDIHLGTLTSGSDYLDTSDISGVINGTNNKETQQRWSIFEELIKTSPDSLTFGKKETTTALNNALLKSIYLQRDANRDLKELCKNVGCEIIVVGNHCIDYKVCGIKWY